MCNISESDWEITIIKELVPPARVTWRVIGSLLPMDSTTAIIPHLIHRQCDSVLLMFHHVTNNLYNERIFSSKSPGKQNFSGKRRKSGTTKPDLRSGLTFLLLSYSTFLSVHLLHNVFDLLVRYIYVYQRVCDFAKLCIC